MADTKSLAALLAEAQAEMPNPKKSREGQKGYQKYKYATLDSVIDIIKKPLNKRGIFLTQPCERADDGGMRVHTVVMHDGERVILDTKPYEYDSDPQEFGKRETYARRYSLLTAFGLAGEDDTDGDTGPKQPANPTNHPLGKTTGKKPDKRTSYLAKIAKYRMALMERGLTEEGLDAYVEATYHVATPDKLTIDQIVDYGKQLAKTVSQYEGNGDEHQQSDD